MKVDLIKEQKNLYFAATQEYKSDALQAKEKYENYLNLIKEENKDEN